MIDLSLENKVWVMEVVEKAIRKYANMNHRKKTRVRENITGMKRDITVQTIVDLCINDKI